MRRHGAGTAGDRTGAGSDRRGNTKRGSRRGAAARRRRPAGGACAGAARCRARRRRRRGRARARGRASGAVRATWRAPGDCGCGARAGAWRAGPGPPPARAAFTSRGESACAQGCGSGTEHARVAGGPQVQVEGLLLANASDDSVPASERETIRYEPYE